jgi:hypothetical protein
MSARTEGARGHPTGSPSGLVAIVAGAVGVCIGAALVVALSWRLRPSESTRAPATPLQAASGADARGLGTELDRLQRRLSNLERARATPSPWTNSGGGAWTAPAERAAPTFTSEQSREHAIRRLAEKEKAFAAEGIDHGWASDASRALMEDVERVSTATGSAVSAIECRTSLCRGSIRWRSYSDAATNLLQVISAPTARSCSTFMATPAPADPTAPYESTIFFDCAEDRAQ